MSNLQHCISQTGGTEIQGHPQKQSEFIGQSSIHEILPQEEENNKKEKKICEDFT